MRFAGPSDFIAAMVRDEFDSVIGEAETVWLEFKSQPYLPWNDAAKRLEFAKDASAMANSGGGLIVFGYATEPDLLTARDIVNSRTPVATKLVDIDSYKKVLESWTYPPIRATNLKWWGIEEEKGILTIEVPPAGEAEQPILVLRAPVDSIRRSILLGYFTRAADRVSETTAAEIHADIQLGRILRRVGIGGLSPGASTPSGPTDEQRRRRLESDMAEGGFGG
jgi:predicted HTH transcriptional regulator